jgi:hypothetical protein
VLYLRHLHGYVHPEGVEVKRAIDMTDAEIDALSAEDASAAMGELVDETLSVVRTALRTVAPTVVAQELGKELVSRHPPSVAAGIAAVMLVRAAQGEVS